MTKAWFMRRLAAAGLGLALALAFAAPADAAEIVLVNRDDPGEGLNDPTGRAPAPGNPGDTLGEQRRNAVLYAANLLASRVVSSIPIVIEVDFKALDCDPGSAGLAFGGPLNLFTDFVGQPRANVLYPAALADAISGRDLFGANDAGVTFTSALDNGTGGDGACLGGADWYYGTDHNPPDNDLNFVSTAVHEMIHGLGFTSAVDLNTGAFADGIPDIFSFYILDLFFSERWPALSNGERADSAAGGGNDFIPGGDEVVWDGAVTTAQGAPPLTGGTNEGRVQLYAPDMLEEGSSISHWSFEVTPNALMEPAPTGNEDVDVRSGIGLAACVLRDLGWTLAAGVSCPDASGAPLSGGRARLVGGSPLGDGGIVGGGGDGGGGGCTLAGGAFDPVWLLLLLTGAWRVARRRH